MGRRERARGAQEADSMPHFLYYLILTACKSCNASFTYSTNDAKKGHCVFRVCPVEQRCYASCQVYPDRLSFVKRSKAKEAWTTQGRHVVCSFITFTGGEDQTDLKIVNWLEKLIFKPLEEVHLV